MTKKAISITILCLIVFSSGCGYFTDSGETIIPVRAKKLAATAIVKSDKPDISIENIQLHKKPFGRSVLKYDIVNNTNAIIWVCDRVDHYRLVEYEIFADGDNLVFSKKGAGIPDGLLIDYPIYSSYVKFGPKKRINVKLTIPRKIKMVELFPKYQVGKGKKKLSDFKGIVISYGYYKDDFLQSYKEDGGVDLQGDGSIQIDCLWQNAEEELEVMKLFEIPRKKK